MDSKREIPADPPVRQPMTGRARDFTVILATTALVLLMLSASSALGFIEALSAFGVIASVAVAWFVGSGVRPAAPPQPVPAEAPRPAALETSATLLTALPLPAIEIGPGQKILAWNTPADEVFQLGNLPVARASAVIRSPALLPPSTKPRPRRGAVTAA